MFTYISQIIWKSSMHNWCSEPCLCDSHTLSAASWEPEPSCKSKREAWPTRLAQDRCSLWDLLWPSLYCFLHGPWKMLKANMDGWFEWDTVLSLLNQTLLRSALPVWHLEVKIHSEILSNCWNLGWFEMLSFSWKTHSSGVSFSFYFLQWTKR